jgi:hypothetical protein
VTKNDGHSGTPGCVRVVVAEDNPGSLLLINEAFQAAEINAKLHYVPDKRLVPVDFCTSGGKAYTRKTIENTGEGISVFSESRWFSIDWGPGCRVP